MASGQNTCRRIIFLIVPTLQCVCIGAASRDRPHSLQNQHHLFQLSADVARPFKPGVDFGCSHRYLMVHSIRIRILSDAEWMAPLPEEVPNEAEGDAARESDLFVSVQLKNAAMQSSTSAAPCPGNAAMQSHAFAAPCPGNAAMQSSTSAVSWQRCHAIPFCSPVSWQRCHAILHLCRVLATLPCNPVLQPRVLATLPCNPLPLQPRVLAHFCSPVSWPTSAAPCPGNAAMQPSTSAAPCPGNAAMQPLASAAPCPGRAAMQSSTSAAACPVQTRLRLRQRSSWGVQTTPGRLVGPAPQTLSSYLVLLPNGQLYISSAICPAGRPAPARHKSKSPVTPAAVQACLLPVGGDLCPLQVAAVLGSPY